MELLQKVPSEIAAVSDFGGRAAAPPINVMNSRVERRSLLVVHRLSD
jgi:hypothetical protein